MNMNQVGMLSPPLTLKKKNSSRHNYLVAVLLRFCLKTISELLIAGNGD